VFVQQLQHDQHDPDAAGQPGELLRRLAPRQPPLQLRQPAWARHKAPLRPTPPSQALLARHQISTPTLPTASLEEALTAPFNIHISSNFNNVVVLETTNNVSFIQIPHRVHPIVSNARLRLTTVSDRAYRRRLQVHCPV